MLFLLFSFRGRINRSQYWFGLLLVTFGNFVGQILVQILSAGSVATATTLAQKFEAYASASALLLPLSIAAFWASLAVQWKRFHDRGRPGWLSLIPLVVMCMLIANVVGDILANADVVAVITHAMPYFWGLLLIGLAMFIDLGCLASKEGPNKYGDPPGAPGSKLPQHIPPGASAKAFVSVQEAMDRAVAQREAAPVVKPSRPAPGFATPRPGLATATAPPAPGPRTFGRRAAR